MQHQTRTARASLLALVLALGMLFAATPTLAAGGSLTGVVNINTATTEQLEMLPGIGESRAQEVVALRKKNGGFKSVDELSEVKNLVREFATRPAGPDEDTLKSIVERLGERDGATQDKFDEQLDRTIDEIQKTIRRATAGPIDVVVEATDVLVDRLFDHDEELTTNLDDLDVEERTTKEKISSSLERLKAAQQASQSED